MGKMFKRDIEEVIKVESQRVYSTLEEEEDVEGSSLRAMREELKKDLDHIRGDDSGWKTFIPEGNMIIDREKIGIEVNEEGEHIKPTKRRRKSTPKFPCPVGCPNLINLGVPLIAPILGELARMTGEVKLGSTTCVKDVLRVKTL